MSSYSSHKKRKIQPQLSHKIQSKLLITSISKHTNTLPSTILSKFDHNRCEEILQKQYAQKFKTDRKRNSSAKKLSASKTTFKEFSKSKIIQPTETIQPQRLFFDGDDYRQKYNQLYDTFLKEKEKWIGQAQKNMSFKQSICQFLNFPDSSTAQQLIHMLQNQKMGKAFRKYIENHRKWTGMQNILKEVMRILQVQENQKILQNLSLRVERFRNLDQCTFKILELQTTNKKIMQQFEQKIKKLKKQQQEVVKREIERIREQAELLKRSKLFLEQQLTLQRQQHQLLLKDLKQLIQSDQDSVCKCLSGKTQVIELQKVIRNLSHRLRDIQVQAEENMFRLLKSNQQMVKFQTKIAQIKDDMSKQITELEQINQQSICQINHLNKQIEQLQTQLEQSKQQSQKLQQLRVHSQNENSDQLRLIAAALNLSQPNIAKIALRLQQIMRERASAYHKIEQLNQNMKQKDRLIADLSEDLKKIEHQRKQMQEQTKTALYQKQQYKFLLNNLRDQIIEMKKQHQQQKNRIVRQKDQQIIRSNRDILQSYATLKDQNDKIKSENTKFKFYSDQLKAQLDMVKKKEEQQRKTFQQNQNQIQKLTEECMRCKKYLRQIQVSFKQVVELQQTSSKKVQTLEYELEQNKKLVKAYQSKSQELQSANIQLSQTRNQLKTQLEKCTADIKELRAERCKIQSTNVQIRLQNINKQNDINRLAEQLKNTTRQNKALKQSNQKIMTELNSVTKKMINSRLDLRKKYIQRIKLIMNQLQHLKLQNKQLKFLVKRSQTQFLEKANQEFQYLHILIEKLEKQYQHKKHQSLKESLKFGIKQEGVNTSANFEQFGVQCFLKSQQDQKLTEKLNGLQAKTQSLLEQNKNAYNYLIELKQAAYQQYQKIIQAFQSFTILSIAQNHNKVLKRSDTPYFNLDQYVQEQQFLQNNNDAVILSSQEQKFKNNEADKINNILQILLQNQNQIPTVPYWSKIQNNFLSLKRKINKNSKQLKLDLSSIDNREPVLHSPSSFYFPQNQIFKRVGTEPDEAQENAQFRYRQTNRSQKQSLNSSSLVQILKRQNQQLKIKLVNHIEQNAQLQFHNHEMQRQLGEMKLIIQEMEIKIVSLSNQTSIQNIENNFKRLLEQLIAENIDSFEQTCRVIMKLMHFENCYITDFQQKMNAKKKKKKYGLFAGLFKQS